MVAELDGNGGFSPGFVYLGGQMVAIQQSNAVSWMHQDPITKSQREINRVTFVEELNVNIQR